MVTSHSTAIDRLACILPSCSGMLIWPTMRNPDLARFTRLRPVRYPAGDWNCGRKLPPISIAAKKRSADGKRAKDCLFIGCFMRSVVRCTPTTDELDAWWKSRKSQDAANVDSSDEQPGDLEHEMVIAEYEKRGHPEIRGPTLEDQYETRQPGKCSAYGRRSCAIPIAASRTRHRCSHFHHRNLSCNLRSRLPQVDSADIEPGPHPLACCAAA